LSGTLTATAACRALRSFFSSLPVSGQRGRASIEGAGPGVALDIGLGLGGGVGGTLGRAGGFEQPASPTPTTPNRTARRLICAI
jgi:DNA-binding beta-propeller fold protein YncE